MQTHKGMKFLMFLSTIGNLQQDQEVQENQEVPVRKDNDMISDTVIIV